MSETDLEAQVSNEEDDGSDLIDVEKGEGEEATDTFPFDYDVFIRKLREKPKFPAEATDCGTKCPKKSYRDWKAPLANRLSINTPTALDLIKRSIPLPKGAVPPLALPSWYGMAIERKIPMVQSPKGLFFYTRGKLGQKLHRKPVVFSLNDPHNLERVVGGPYTALHDPHSKACLYNPNTHPLLLDRGFINDANDVLCSLKEFNRFREYLKTLYCDRVWKQIEIADAFWKTEREQVRALLKAQSQAEADGKEAINAARIAAAKKYQMEAAEFKRKQLQQRDQMNEARLRQWQAEKERKLLEHIMHGIEEARRNKEKLLALYEMRLQQQRNIMTKAARKQLETEERRRNDKAMMQAAYNKFLLEWIQSKYVYSYEKLVEKRQLQDDLRASQKYHAKKRQRRLERYREAMPRIIEKRKAEEARIWAIVRKYAMRWLEKVRRRLNAPKDVKHESCWIGQSKGVLDDTVKYLRQESGYEKLDDFILNIMKLKKQIQAQIELEEAEEAAVAAAEGQDDEEEGDDDGSAGKPGSAETK